ncbi:MAG: TetR/AcrR family transcriptional regulator [Oscillospiraceae bacterium]|nr:TetR/AcrR family transcriptional regulator [Oscillospiraceae bacterium]
MESLVNKPRTQRGRTTLNNILSAAAQVFYEKGYHDASINDITRLAGVASGTFYVYFDGKYNLYKYLLLQCSHIIRKHLSLSVKDCKTRREVERVGMKAWLEFALENQYMYNIIWESLYVDRELFVDYYQTFSREYIKGLEAAKLTDEIIDIDSEVLSYILMGASNFLGLNWCVFKEDPEAIDHVVDDFMKILDGGIFSKDFKAEPAPIEHKPTEVKQRFRFQVVMDDDAAEKEPE